MLELKDESAGLEDKFLKAEDLRNITLSQEELFEIAKINICDSIMDSMVGVATKNGQFFYATNILAQMNTDLRQAVMDRFIELGYDVSLSDVVSDKTTGQKYQVLSIGWMNKEETKEAE